MSEIWKDIRGFEGRYQISNKGRVKNAKTGTILKPYLRKNGYLYVRPYKDGKNHDKSVHGLVAEAFITNPHNYSEVNHKDENKTNNDVSNLEWCNHSHNINHGTRNKRVAEKLSKAVFQIDLNGNIVDKFYGLHEAHRQTGVDFRNIQKCCKGLCKTVGGYMWRYANE